MIKTPEKQVRDISRRLTELITSYHLPDCDHYTAWPHYLGSRGLPRESVKLYPRLGKRQNQINILGLLLSNSLAFFFFKIIGISYLWEND